MNKYIYKQVGPNTYKFVYFGNSNLMKYCRFGGKDGQSVVDMNDLGYFDPPGGPFISTGMTVLGRKITRIWVDELSIDNEIGNIMIEVQPELRKVVINTIHGGFGLSHEGMLEYLHNTGKDFSYEAVAKPLVDYLYKVDGERFWEYDLDRDDPALVKAVEELGTKANGAYAKLKIVEIPAEVEWHIEEYDGREWIAENHRTWD